ncbi:hypothetical protein E2C01_005090 [Portunus trituberculatus]|uniref:Secreted protein n=1 Tax=Portunus trituberculatus TaxID=210409 RepID=A0A5B7CS81_PORTR|nr:hypothetical protein [Portunus trituberculatus]
MVTVTAWLLFSVVELTEGKTMYVCRQASGASDRDRTVGVSARSATASEGGVGGCQTAAPKAASRRSSCAHEHRN